jgi:hypothetical protein
MFPDFAESDIAGIVINRAIRCSRCRSSATRAWCKRRAKNPDLSSTRRIRQQHPQQQRGHRSVNAFLRRFEPEFRSAA